MFFLLVAGFSPAKEVSFSVLGTTDLHGHIYPYNYYTGKDEDCGLAKVYTVVKEARKLNPNNILIDCGDTFQGTPLEYLHIKNFKKEPDPMIQVMNFMHYDAMVIGNHDFDFGLEFLNKIEREAKFPYVSANIYLSPVETFFQPYVVKNIQGVKIGILGITTPATIFMVNPENYKELIFGGSLKETSKWVKILREKEKVNFLILAIHEGLGVDLATKRKIPPNFEGENEAYDILTKIKGIDLAFLGHTHREIGPVNINGTIVLQAGKWGGSVAEADIIMDDSSGSWKVKSLNGRLVKIDKFTPSDAEILKMAEVYHSRAEKYLDEVIGKAEESLSCRDAYFKDTPLIELINKMQLEYGKGEVSITSVFNPETFVPKGPVTRRKVAGLYPYENVLYMIEVNGKILKDALEYSARFFKPYEPGKRIEDLINSDIPGYNYDIAEGLEYKIDLTKPVGERIFDLKFNGNPLKDSQKIKLCLNNFRYYGGGGYTMFKGSRILNKSDREIRELLIDYIKDKKTISGKVNNNWKILVPVMHYR